MRWLAGCLLLAAAGAWMLGDSPGAPAPEEAQRSGLPGFDGSDFCAACHPGPAATWTGSLHARTVHAPSESERELLSRSLLCGDWEPKHILGERHAKRFMVDSESEPGRHVLLPCRYDVGPAEWAILHESDWKTLSWEKHCGACHTTAFSSEDFTFAEMKVGCEACHGPGSLHGDYSSRGEMLFFKALETRREIDVCGACHLQGGTSRRTGLSYAYNHVAGQDPFADYDFPWKSLDGVKDDVENPIDIHQKLLMRDVVTKGRADLRCTSCHAIHATRDRGHEKHEALPRQEYCYLCHEREGFAIKEYNQACNVCEF